MKPARTRPPAFAAFMLLAISVAIPAPANAAGVWHARQGDVVHVTMPYGGNAPARLRALGRDWPVHRDAPGRLDGWIGVDLGVKPGDYPVRWRIGAVTRSQTLHVEAGRFRISRIHVPRKMAVFDAPALARIRADHAALRRAARQPVHAAPAFAFRAPPVRGVVSTPFGARRYVNGEPRSPHSGLDIAAAEGAPVLAPMAGRVLMVRKMFLSGNTVLLGHGEGLTSVYAHLRAVSVRQGQWIEAGARIGETGHTGRATGPHLHWGVRFRGARVNPASLLPPKATTSAGLPDR